MNEATQFRLRKISPSGKKEAPFNNIILTDEKPVTLGRVLQDDVHVRLLSKSTPLMISRKHATLSVENSRVFVVDHNVRSLNVFSPLCVFTFSYLVLL